MLHPVTFLLIAALADGDGASASTQNADLDAPIIEDVAAAASPGAAPVVTVMVSDADSGVGEATVFYRVAGATEWIKVALVGGESTLFLARLPLGVERLGFSYYVEATDKRGNGPARIGSPEIPIDVPRAEESTRDRLERTAQATAVLEEPVSVHPAFIMVALGVGVLTGAGAAGYLIDLSISQNRLADVQAELADDPSAGRRADLVRARTGYEDAVVYDTAIAAVLGVVAAAGLITGTALLVAANLE